MSRNIVSRRRALTNPIFERRELPPSGLPGRLEGMPSRLGGVEGRRNPMSFHNTPLVDGTVPPMRSSGATAIRSARPNALNTVSAT